MSPADLREKIERRLRETVSRARQAAVERGLLPGGTDYRRFIVVGGIRTGSTMLTSYLGSHPDVRMFFELFHRYPRSIPFNAPGYRKRGNDAAVVERRNTDPVRFLEHDVFTRQPRHVDAVGFKLLYTQGRAGSPWWYGPEFDRWWAHLDRSSEPNWSEARSDLWAHLQADRDLAVIHLTRRNPLHKAVSAELAKHTGRWGVGATGGAAAGPVSATVRLNMDHCLQDFEADRRMQEETDAFFEGHDVLHLTYETLVADPDAEMDRAQRFLGLRVRPLHTRTRKLRERSLPEVIENYDEVAAALRGTPWEHCLADEPAR